MNDTPARYIDLLSDFGFKLIFGTEENKDFLRDFLSTLLPERHRILSVDDLAFLPSEQLGTHRDERKAIFDISCKGANGERFIVEVQRAKQKFFKDRTVFYASFPIRQMSEVNDWNFELQPVYSINIPDFEFSDAKKDPQFIHKVQLKDQRGKRFYDKLHFIYVELPKFTKSIESIKKPIDRWLYVLRHLPEFEQLPNSFDMGVFPKMMEQAQLAKMTELERRAYEASVKSLRDNINQRKYAQEEGKREGHEEGLQEGIVRGIKRGIEQGIERGIKGANSRAVLKLTQRGFSTEEVADMLDFTTAQVAQLLDQGKE